MRYHLKQFSRFQLIRNHGLTKPQKGVGGTRALARYIFINISVYLFSLGLPSDLPFSTWLKKCFLDTPRLPLSLSISMVGAAECGTICFRWKVDKVWMSKFIAHEIEVALQSRLTCESFSRRFH